MAPRSKSYSQAPFDPALKPETKQFLDWVTVQLNQLTGQGIPPVGSGLQTFGPNIIDPTTSQIVSAGSRTMSLATAIISIPTSTSITFYWDGTNGSQPFKVFRDDGSIFGPSIAGSPQAVSGLTASTTYFFYPYFDESLKQIQFAKLGGVSVGSPPIAFTATNYLASQQQILRGRIPLSTQLASVGVATTASGTGTAVTGGSGGGAGGGLYCPLSGAPVQLYGKPEWWSKEVKPNEDFISIRTETGRVGIFSPTHRAYIDRGLRAVWAFKQGDFALTEDGEEEVQDVQAFKIPGATVDAYHATKGHIYSAWGFISHNFKPV